MKQVTGFYWKLSHTRTTYVKSCYAILNSSQFDIMVGISESKIQTAQYWSLQNEKY
jgi:hypothetical protein